MAFLRFFRSLYFGPTFWVAWVALTTGFLGAYLFPFLLPLMYVASGVAFLLFLADGIALYRTSDAIFARRSAPDRLSNGDENPITIYLENRYPFVVHLEVIDEIPYQFQRRDLCFRTRIASRSQQQIQYHLRPTRRGEYEFGQTNVYAHTPLRLVKRRFRFTDPKTVAVYPSFLQMRQYTLLAVANRLNEIGIKRIRRVGHSMEFDQIRTYVAGDDLRSINWKATARKAELMVNAYQDERAQSVYCIIDKGRTMQSPFEGLTLLDYAINSSLILSNVTLSKQDKIGLVTFSDVMGQVLPADRRTGHLQKILELLYRQTTRFMESDYERLSITVRNQVRQRSLLLLFTNFETLEALQRQLPYLRRLAKDHLLVTILFENTETKELTGPPAQNVKQIYLKTIARRFDYEKKKIVLELQRYGIQTILTTPQLLSVSTINKYLELKSRGAI